MSDVMRILSAILHYVAVVLRPVLWVLVDLPGRAHPLLGLVPISVLLGAAMVLVFRSVSNQALIAELRERMKGHLLGAIVYGHSFRIVMRCLSRAVGLNARYLVHALVPMLLMIVPVLILYVQLQHRYTWRPPGAGEECLFWVTYRGSPPERASLAVPPEAGRWRTEGGFLFPSARRIVWKVVPQGPCNAFVLVKLGEHEGRKSVVAGTERLLPLSPMRTDGTSLAQGFLHPDEPLLSADAGIRGICFAYPERRLPGSPWYTHWAVWFFGLTVLAGLAWSKLLGVAL